MHENLPLIDLYHRHVGMGFDRQLRLAEFLEETADGEDWQYTTSTGTLTFGSNVQFDAHDLGSHATPDNSWLWVWNNPHLNLTPGNRTLAKAVRELGHRIGIAVFLANSKLDLDSVLGEELSEHAAHVFGIILAGEIRYDAYYTFPFTHGRVTVLIRDDRLRYSEESPLNRIGIAFPQVISALPVFDHRAALMGYAKSYGLKTSSESEQVLITDAGKNILTATFDSLHRLAELNYSIIPKQREE